MLIFMYKQGSMALLLEDGSQLQTEAGETITLE